MNDFLKRKERDLTSKIILRKDKDIFSNLQNTQKKNKSEIELWLARVVQ